MTMMPLPYFRFGFYMILNRFGGDCTVILMGFIVVFDVGGGGASLWRGGRGHKWW